MTTVYPDLPRRLYIADGQLHLIDGGDVQEYLKTWQEEGHVPNGLPVTLITREYALELRYAELVAAIG